MSRQRGLFVTFEGGEGSGKSTQARFLAAYLEARGESVLMTREPGGSPAAEILRKVVLDGHGKEFGPLAEAALFAAARADHVSTVIEPALRGGVHVISDRFADSTRVYQGVAGGLDMASVAMIEDAVVGSTRPDMTFVLDVSDGVQQERRLMRKIGARDRFEDEEAAFHRAIVQGFRDLASKDPERVRLVDGNGTPDAVRALVAAAFEKAREALS